MKLRYYMRGLGIGILVTAILMSVTIDGKTEKLTDAEIIERAEALGMEKKYESTVLAEAVSDNETEDDIADEDAVNKDSAVEDTQGQIEVEEIKTPETEPQEIETDVTEELPEEKVEGEGISEGEEAQEEQTQEPENVETVQITVQGGDGSGTVARKLAEAGLVEDAKVYDKYLCSNGYDKRICTGTHTIPVGASDEEIAKIITSRP